MRTMAILGVLVGFLLPGCDTGGGTEGGASEPTVAESVAPTVCEVRAALASACSDPDGYPCTIAIDAYVFDGWSLPLCYMSCAPGQYYEQCHEPFVDRPLDCDEASDACVALCTDQLTGDGTTTCINDCASIKVDLGCQ